MPRICRHYSSFDFFCLFPATRLNEYIHHYETLDYDPVEIHERHLRVKRWAAEGGEYAGAEEPTVHLAFKADDRRFKLRLKRDTSVFSRNLHVEGDDGSFEPIDDSHIYAGHLEGMSLSFLENGTLFYIKGLCKQFMKFCCCHFQMLLTVMYSAQFKTACLMGR